MDHYVIAKMPLKPMVAMLECVAIHPCKIETVTVRRNPHQHRIIVEYVVRNIHSLRYKNLTPTRVKVNRQMFEVLVAENMNLGLQDFEAKLCGLDVILDDNLPEHDGVRVCCSNKDEFIYAKEILEARHESIKF